MTKFGRSSRPKVQQTHSQLLSFYFPSTGKAAREASSCPQLEGSVSSPQQDFKTTTPGLQKKIGKSIFQQRNKSHRFDLVQKQSFSSFIARPEFSRGIETFERESCSQQSFGLSRFSQKASVQTNDTFVGSPYFTITHRAIPLDQMFTEASKVNSNPIPREPLKEPSDGMFKQGPKLGNSGPQTGFADLELTAKFDVDCELGRGAFTTVREATRRSDGCRFALKTYDYSKGRASVIENVIQNEVRILKKVSFEHIIRLEEIVRTKLHTHIILELLPGTTFETFLKLQPRHRLSEVQVRPFYQQLVRTVSFLHSKRIYHRDLKLENIMVLPSNLIKLIDFGFAVDASQICSNPLICGTPYYMAPETASALAPDFELAEVWSLAVILYKAISGSFPFKEINPDDKRSKLCYVYRRPFGISDALNDLFLRSFDLSIETRARLTDLMQHPWIS